MNITNNTSSHFIVAILVFVGSIMSFLQSNESFTFRFIGMLLVAVGAIYAATMDKIKYDETKKKQSVINENNNTSKKS
jgi:uncharacterized membrane-anchored protein